MKAATDGAFAGPDDALDFEGVGLLDDRQFTTNRLVDLLRVLKT